MKRRVAVQSIVVAVVAVFAVGIWLSGDELNADWLRFYSLAVLVVTSLFALWDRWFWRLTPVQRLDSVPRDIMGTWKGVLTTSWEDPSTGDSPPPKPAFLVVRQTNSKVSAVLLTDESRSQSSLSAVSAHDGTVTLDYFYLNSPDSRHRGRSPIHPGSASLAVTGSPATRLKGQYWTDRNSRGELDFPERSLDVADDYDEAARLFTH